MKYQFLNINYLLASMRIKQPEFSECQKKRSEKKINCALQYDEKLKPMFKEMFNTVNKETKKII